MGLQKTNLTKYITSEHPQIAHLRKYLTTKATRDFTNKRIHKRHFVNQEESEFHTNVHQNY